jgi:hypothetical protein
MKALLSSGALALALGATGCTSTGALNPTASSDITSALAVACPVVAAVSEKVPSDANSQAAYSLLVSLCPPNAPPTNAVVAALDILNAYEVLKPLVK